MTRMNDVVTITINSDASFHPEHKIGAYAFYIICDRFKIQRAGKFTNELPTNSQEAEMMAIGNALAALLNMEEPPTCKWLIINTDCRNAIDKIRRQEGAIGKKVAKLWQQTISRLKSRKNVFRHVKAHSNVNDSRSWVNSWCDEEAKKHMRAQVKLIT